MVRCDIYYVKNLVISSYCRLESNALHTCILVYKNQIYNYLNKVVLHPKLRSRAIFQIILKLNHKSCLNNVVKKFL